MADLTRKERLVATIIQHNLEVNSGDNDWFVASLLADGCIGLNTLDEPALEALVDEFIDDEDKEDIIAAYVKRRSR